MNLNDLPRDVLILLALDMDFPEIINLCQSSSNFNNKICKNNYFWMNKLQKDFGLVVNVEKAKREYIRVLKLLTDEPDTILASGIRSENFKLVKAAVEWGANLKRMINLLDPVTFSLQFKNEDIILYLLEKSNITENMVVLGDMINAVPYQLNRTVKCRMVLNLYSIVLPYIARTNEKKFPNMWKISPNKLEELYNENRWCISDEFYNKWKPFYTELAQKYQ